MKELLEELVKEIRLQNKLIAISMFLDKEQNTYGIEMIKGKANKLLDELASPIIKEQGTDLSEKESEDDKVEYGFRKISEEEFNEAYQDVCIVDEDVIFEEGQRGYNDIARKGWFFYKNKGIEPKIKSGKYHIATYEEYINYKAPV